MRVYDPTAPSPEATRNLRRSVGDLSGKVVGFIDNAKPNFNLLINSHSAQWDKGTLEAEHCALRHGCVR